MEITSKDYDQVFNALIKAKKEMKSVIKDAQNSHLKNKYATLGAYIEATEDALLANDLLLFCTMDPCEKNTILVMTLMHKTGQWIRSYLPLINTKGDSQGLGSALSYQRRYGMSALFNLTAEDDDGHVASSKPSVLPLKQENKHDLDKNTQKISPEMAKALEIQLRQTPSKYSDSVYARFIELGYPTIFDIPQSMFEAVMNNAIKNIGKPNV